MGSKTKEEFCAELRKQQCIASRQGKFLAFDLDKISLDLKVEFKTDIYPETWTDHVKWAGENGMMTNEDEKVAPNGEKTSIFMYNANFNLCVISKASTEEEFLANVAGIPHIEDFMKVVVA